MVIIYWDNKLKQSSYIECNSDIHWFDDSINFRDSNGVRHNISHKDMISIELVEKLKL